MSFEVRYTSEFEHSLKKIAKKHKSIRNDILNLIIQLELDPKTGIQIRPNLYKIRLNISGTNKGKSGGARVITYLLTVNETVFLAAIYLKSESDTVDEDALIKQLTDQKYI